LSYVWACTMYVPPWKSVSLQCLSKPSSLFKASVFPNSLRTVFDFCAAPITILSVNLVFVCCCTCCLKKHPKNNHLSIVCFWENRQCIITLSEVCMVVFRIVVWLWRHFCKVWMGWMCKQHLAVIPKFLYVVTTYFLFQENFTFLSICWNVMYSVSLEK